jgi:hypothetical protein
MPGGLGATIQQTKQAPARCREGQAAPPVPVIHWGIGVAKNVHMH